MIGVKNASAASIAFPAPGEGRTAHPSSVVLDLDYTIAIPGGNTPAPMPAATTRR
jgi:2-methylfumaryl-CoA hydratase